MTSLSNQRRRGASRRSGRTQRRPSIDLWRRLTLPGSPNLKAIVLLWSATLLLGGSSRPDVVQIALLRPVAALAAAFGFWTLERRHISHHRFLVGMAAVIVLLVSLHLVPLPYGLWSALPGRDVIVGLDHAIGLKGAWRPISMAPAYTWNALFSLLIPLAFLVNGIQLTRDDMIRVGIIVVAGGVASAALGFLQLLGTPNGVLYPFTIRLTQPEAVGFFANRNHQALLIASVFPLLAAYAARRGIHVAEDRRRIGIALGIAVFLIPFLIVVGSRAGLLAGTCGLASTPFIYLHGARVHRSKQRARRWGQYALSILFVVAIGALSIVVGRATAIERLVDSYSADDARYDFWSVVLANYKHFMPFGSGIGSYQPVFQIFEPRNTLTYTYSNHAHNDWLEVVLTAGLPGILLMILGLVAFAVATVRHLRLQERGGIAPYRLAGLVIVALIAFASLVDYPMRAPIIAALFVMSCLWAGSDCRAQTDRE